MDGITGAFVNDDIMLLVDNDQPLDDAALKKTLEPFKLKLGELKKADELPF